MQANELQDWLLSDGVKGDLEKIAAKVASLEFEAAPHSDISSEETIDWVRLLLAGSILARSPKRHMKEAALRIATAAVLMGREGSIRDAGALLLEKLSNARAVSLAQSRGLVAADLMSRLGIGARMEAVRRTIQQSVLESFTGRWLPVNEFQANFWNEAASPSVAWLSASAPTASGKTYLVQHWLIDSMLTSDARVAIYVAPTRALVSEIESSFQVLVKDLGVAKKIDVASLPVREFYDAALGYQTKTIFVFTQERLHLLANVVGGGLKVDILVVDEAHKIGDGGRGVILQAAIERVSLQNQGVRAIFISPATQNPEVLLEDAPSTVRRTSVDSDLPTVLQNIIFCSQVPGRSTEWKLDLRFGAHFLPLGKLHLAHRPTNLRKRIAFIAAAAGKKGGTLVYANGAAEAEQIAVLIAQTSDLARSGDAELSSLAELARKGVHPDYQLANVVEEGVAFHYGNMPSLLRLEIERLFREGKLRFLVCTSTLVEGVNLACRTIVVRGPRKGKGNPMEAPDFWNLAGRAGRWGNEFQGNIICIDPGNDRAWPMGVPERARYPIRRETDNVLDRGAELEGFLSSRLEATSSDVAASSDLEQVASYLLAAYVKKGSIEEAAFARRRDPEYMSRLNSILARLASHIDLPADLVARHPGVSALGMQKLLSLFRSEIGREETFLLEPPEADSAVSRLCNVMQIVNSAIYPAFVPESRIPLYALIVVEWLRGFPLSYIIRKRIEYHKRRGHQIKLPELIRSTMELVEQYARFRAPKYLSAYVDVLKLHLGEVGRSDLLDEALDIGLALEFGVSTKTLLSLMKLGLSRMSAVALNEVIADDSLDQIECINWLLTNRSFLLGSDIPLLVMREIDTVLAESLVASGYEIKDE